MEHRKAPRRVPRQDEPIFRVRLRTGREMTVVNVSDTGALLEGCVRLLPGTHVDVHVITLEGRLLVRSRVVRCSVTALQPEVVYQGALAFDRRVETAAGYVFPRVAAGIGVIEGPGYPLQPPDAESPGAEPLVA